MRTIWHGRRNRKLIQANNIPEIAEDIQAAMRPAHWNAADHVSINTIESGLKREEALAFRDNYVKNLSQMPGWSVRVTGPS